MNKMNLYKLIEQQYNNFKNDEGCESCPSKTLRDRILGIHRIERDCFCEIECLANKYNIDYDIDTSLCRDNMIASLKIAKKISEKVNKI